MCDCSFWYGLTKSDDGEWTTNDGQKSQAQDILWFPSAPDADDNNCAYIQNSLLY